MNINKKRQTAFTAVFLAAALALTACGGGDDEATNVTVDATVLPPTTAAAAAETTVPETTVAPTTTAPQSTTSGPNMTTGPAQVIPNGWEVHDPGTGYTIALPPHWIDATDVIKGEVKPEDLPGFEGTSLSPEQLQESFGAALELMSLFAVDTKAATEEFAPNINILTTPLAEDISADQAKGQFESQLNQVGEVRNSEVTSVDGFDAIRTEFTTKVGGLDATGVQVAVIQPGSLTVITYTGLEVPKNLDQIINTFKATG